MDNEYKNKWMDETERARMKALLSIPGWTWRVFNDKSNRQLTGWDIPDKFVDAWDEVFCVAEEVLQDE